MALSGPFIQFSDTGCHFRYVVDGGQPLCASSGNTEKVVSQISNWEFVGTPSPYSHPRNKLVPRKERPTSENTSIWHYYDAQVELASFVSTKLLISVRPCLRLDPSCLSVRFSFPGLDFST